MTVPLELDKNCRIIHHRDLQRTMIVIYFISFHFYLYDFSIASVIFCDILLFPILTPFPEYGIIIQQKTHS